MRTIKVTRSAIEAFMRVWPCSGLQRVRSITADFDNDGNLVDLLSYPYGAIDKADMNAVNAILDDMKNGILGTRISPTAV